MKRSQPLRAVAAAGAAGLLLASRTQAQPSSVEVTRLEFRAPFGCGSFEDFAARIVGRSSRIRLVASGDAARSLLVEIVAADAASVRGGRVTVVEADGAVRTRQLKAKSCEETLEGLSLIATVTLDPEALSRPAEPVEAPPAQPVPPPISRPQEHSVAPRPVSTPPRFSLGLGGLVLIQTAPELAFGAEGSLGLELSPGRALSPLFRLLLGHAQARDVQQPNGQAGFAYTQGSLEVCPVRLGPAVFGIRPCGFVSFGAVKAWGSAPVESETHVRPFGAAGPALLAQLELGKMLEIIAVGRAGLAFFHDEFAFDEEVFFTTPALGFSAGVGAAVGFP